MNLLVLINGKIIPNGNGNDVTDYLTPVKRYLELRGFSLPLLFVLLRVGWVKTGKNFQYRDNSQSRYTPIGKLYDDCECSMRSATSVTLRPFLSPQKN